MTEMQTVVGEDRNSLGAVLQGAPDDARLPELLAKELKHP